MSGDIRLSDEGGVATRLLSALASLVEQVKPGTFALIGGLAVMTRLTTVHRVTDDIDAVSEQLGDDPSDIAVVLGEDGVAAVRRLVRGVKVDHIDVGKVPASKISSLELPTNEWDRAFVLAHRWGLDSATPVVINAVETELVVATVTCPAASPASLVAMKLQSAPRRPRTRIDKAANDYLDLHRLLSSSDLGFEIARDLTSDAPHDLGEWAIERIRLDFIERADDMARAIRSSVDSRAATERW